MPRGCLPFTEDTQLFPTWTQRSLSLSAPCRQRPNYKPYFHVKSQLLKLSEKQLPGAIGYSNKQETGTLAIPHGHLLTCVTDEAYTRDSHLQSEVMLSRLSKATTGKFLSYRISAWCGVRSISCNVPPMNNYVDPAFFLWNIRSNLPQFLWLVAISAPWLSAYWSWPGNAFSSVAYMCPAIFGCRGITSRMNLTCKNPGAMVSAEPTLFFWSLHHPELYPSAHNVWGRQDVLSRQMV